MTKFFDNCSNLDELKKAYRDAAKANHPDMGGDTATMQRINAAYTARFEILKNRQNETAAADPDGSTKATTEAPDDFINIIAALLKLDGLEVELCGRWLWIGGNTMTHKEALKAAGCRWSQSKNYGPGILPRMAPGGTNHITAWTTSGRATAAKHFPAALVPQR